MNTPFARIRRGAVFFGIVLVVAIVGFRFLSEPPRTWLDSIYLVVITISSVGFGEKSRLSPEMQLFTIGVIIFGMLAAGYTIGGLLQMMTEGEVSRAMGRRRVTRDIERLKDHVIICGFGRIGEIVAKEVQRQGRPFVIIDAHPERVVEVMGDNTLVLTGDATEEDVLLAARIDRAHTLVSGLPSDASNVFITLTSRNLNENVQIITRAEHATSQRKLIQAGADRVVLPALIGGQRMARMITRPTTSDLIELLIDGDVLDIELDELSVTSESPLVGAAVGEIDVHRRHQLLIISVKHADGTLTFNPDADYAFDEGDTIIVMGKTDDIDRFREAFGLGV